MPRSYVQRASESQNLLAKRILETIEKKKSNLAVSVDVTKKAEFLDIIDKVGPFVCCVKTHIDIIQDYDSEVIPQLLKLQKKHGFIIFEDRKFADIGSTVSTQYSSGIYKISSWADLVTIHALPGEGIIAGLKTKVDSLEKRGALLLAEMSSSGNLMGAGYIESTVAMGRRNKDFVVGFIATRRVVEEDEGFLIFTPGVGMDTKGDSLGQKYRTPQECVLSGSDVIIVGRGIIQSKDVVTEARKYREAGWNAYLTRISGN